MKKMLSALLALCMVFSLAACSQQTNSSTPPVESNASSENTSSPSTTPAEAYKLKFGHVLAANSPEGEIWQWFADEINARTNGAVTIIVYPAEELGSAAVQVESLKVGTIDLFCQATTVFAGPCDVPTMSLVSIPFLFGDSALYQKTMEESGLYAEQAEQMEVAGLHIVNTDRNFFRGDRVLCSTKPIQTVDDLQRLRFRAYESDAYVGAYSALGASPLIVSWSETFSAIQNKTVDACSSSLDQVISAKLCEVAPYITWTYEYNNEVVLVANNDSWSKLPGEYQEVITAVANEAGTKMAESIAEQTSEMVELLETEYGCTFYDIDTAALRAKLASFYQQMGDNGTIPESILSSVL